MPIPELEHANSADAYLLRRAPFYGTFKAINQALGIYRIHGSNFSLGITHDNYGEMRQRLLHALDALPFYEKEAHKRNITFHPDFIFKNLILLRYRILSKRIAPEKHLFQEDTTGKLLWMTLKNCMLHKRYGFARKIYELIITLWVFLRPLNKIKTFPKN